MIVIMLAIVTETNSRCRIEKHQLSTCLRVNSGRDRLLVT